jgi:hypothetical protein
MTKDDERLMEKIIDDFLAKMGIEYNEFQKSLIHHMSSP